MNLLYDISGLGELLQHRAGTGVPRVIENVLHALAGLGEECHVTACAPSSPNFALDYFQQDLAARGILLARSLADDVPGRWLGAVDRWMIRSQSRQRSLPWRLLRRIFLPPLVRTRPFFGRLPSQVLRAADVYHSPHGAIPAQIRFMAQRERPQVALTVYDLIPYRHPEFFLPGMADAQTAILRTMRPEQDWYLAISECTKQDLCEIFGIEPQRVFVTPLAADPQVFYRCEEEAIAAARRRYQIPSGPYLMSLCTLEPRKNVQTIIKSFAEIVRAGEIDDLHLLLVGGKGWMGDDLHRVLERWPEVRRRIILPGYVPDEDLAPLYSGAFCFAYLSHYEGFGLPPLEAMQCGTPVLVSNTSSLPEVVGEAGMLFDPLDVEAFAQGIVSLWRDPVRRAQLGAESLAHAARFSWEQCAKDTFTAYRTMQAGATA